jgi:hypothetical protein
MQALNTHIWVKRFIAAGTSEKLAEEIVTAIDEHKKQSDLATKDDLKVTILELKTGDLAEVKGEILGIKKDLGFNRTLLWFLMGGVYLPLLEKYFFP